VGDRLVGRRRDAAQRPAGVEARGRARRLQALTAARGPATSALARAAASAADPQRDLAAAWSGDGLSAMSEMLMPARPRASAMSAIDARAVGDRDAQLAHRAADEPASSSARRSPAASLPGARSRPPAPARRAAPRRRGVPSIAARARRGWRGRCRATARGSAPATRVRRGSSGRSAEALAAERAAACATSTLATTCGRCETAAIMPVVGVGVDRGRLGAEAGDEALQALEQRARTVVEVGVRYQTAPSKRSSRAWATPAASLPASGWPPTKRSSPLAATTARFVEPTSVTRQPGGAARGPRRRLGQPPSGTATTAASRRRARREVVVGLVDRAGGERLGRVGRSRGPSRRACGGRQADRPADHADADDRDDQAAAAASRKASCPRPRRPPSTLRAYSAKPSVRSCCGPSQMASSAAGAPRR
jgi:hypothetical protein